MFLMMDGMKDEGNEGNEMNEMKNGSWLSRAPNFSREGDKLANEFISAVSIY